MFSAGLAWAGVSDAQAPETQPQAEDKPLEILSLSAPQLDFRVTPQIGGRVLHLSLPGQDNLLKVGDAVNTNPEPKVSAEGNDIPYLGHIVWVGPQSGWWSQQSVNMDRRRQRAAWPPDPFNTQVRNTVVEKTDKAISLAGVPSPVSGIQLYKDFQVTADNGMVLKARGVNSGHVPVSWDLWFNSRVKANTRVYLPVKSTEDVRLNMMSPEANGTLDTTLKDGVLGIHWSPLAAGIDERKGKFFIMPSGNWMAGFNGHQLLLIRYPLVPLGQLHPEHALVEVYVDVRPEMADGLIEMETHGPYRAIVSREEISAQQEWRLYEYPGADDPAEQREFLRRLLAREG